MELGARWAPKGVAGDAESLIPRWIKNNSNNGWGLRISMKKPNKW